MRKSEKGLKGKFVENNCDRNEKDINEGVRMRVPVRETKSN